MLLEYQAEEEKKKKGGISLTKKAREKESSCSGR